MLAFRPKRTPRVQKEYGTSASVTISVVQNETDWISNAFRVAELASAAGGLLPFPYLKGAADLVIALLKPIQRMQQNRDSYKALAINVTTILQILHEETKKDPETASPLNYFEKDCKTFYRYLQHILNDLESFDKPEKFKLFRRYFRADREKDLLAYYQSQIEEFRNNLVLRGVIRLQICSNANETDSHFEKIRLGDLNVLRSRWNRQAEHWEVRWKHETRTRMVRVYKGRNAISKFKAEKEWYSRYRHPSLMQLFGLITSKESPGLVFHNPWCVPLDEYPLNEPNQRFGDAWRRYIEQYYIQSSYDEGLNYVADSISHHAIFSWWDLEFFHTFIGFKNRDDGYIGYYHVNVLDGRGVVGFEWLSNIPKDIPAFQRQTTIIDDDKPLKELSRIIEKLCSPARVSVLSDPSFLWDLYGTIYTIVWKDVPAPGYSVCIGDILQAHYDEDRFEASDALKLGFIPCEKPTSLDWYIQDKKFHTYLETANRLSIEDCGERFRIRLPVDLTGVSATNEVFQTVVIEYDVMYLDDATWGQMTRAYISQIAHLYAKIDRVHHFDSFCAVTGFSWHLQIPTRLECSIATSEYKELYFFISKPDVHDETLDTYWSLDPSGSEKLNCFVIKALGFDSKSFSIQIFRTLRVLSIDDHSFRLIWDAHVMLDIDPESNEAARLLGLPLLCLSRLGDVSDDTDRDTTSFESYHTAKDEAEDRSVDVSGHETE